MIRRPPRSTLFPTRRSSDLQEPFLRRPDAASGRSRFAPPGYALHPRRRSEEHTSELQSQFHLVCRLLLEKKKKNKQNINTLTLTMNTNTCNCMIEVVSSRVR